MNFVLDNSVSMRWLLPDRVASHQTYAERVLAELKGGTAVVPSLWWLELANVLARCERAREISPSDSARFVDLLAGLPIEELALEGSALLRQVLPLARAYRLSAYAAAYLDLAMRESLPLATLDEDLRRAGEAAGVAIHLCR